MASNPSQPQQIFMGNTSISKVYSHASGSQVKIRPMGPTWTTLRTGTNSAVESDGSTALRIVDDYFGEIATILATPGFTQDTPPTGYHQIYQEELYLLWKWMGNRNLDYSRFIGELENLNGGSYQDLYTNTIGYEEYGSGLYTFYYPYSTDLSNINAQKISFNPNAMNPTLLISDIFYHRFNVLVNEIYGFSYRIQLSNNFRFWFPYCLEDQGYVRFNIEAQNQLRTTIFTMGYPFTRQEQRYPPINGQFGGLFSMMQGDTVKIYGANSGDMLNSVTYQSSMMKRGIDTIMTRYNGEIMVQDAQYQQMATIGVNLTDYSQTQSYDVVNCDFRNSSERSIYLRSPYIAIPNDYMQIDGGFIELM